MRAVLYRLKGSTDFLYFDVRIVDPVNWNFSFYWHVGNGGGEQLAVDALPRTELNGC